VGDRYRTPDGWTVEVVRLEIGERLRVRHNGFYIADVRSADDLGRWIPATELAQLEREPLILGLDLGRGSCQVPRRRIVADRHPQDVPRDHSRLAEVGGGHRHKHADPY
jgi:hypothetical protein